MTRPVEPAVIVWAALITTALGADLWLLRHGHRSLSAVAGDTTIGRLAVAHLHRHLTGALEIDVLSALGARVARRTLVAVP